MAENCMKMKEIGPREGAHPCTQLESPMWSLKTVPAGGRQSGGLVNSAVNVIQISGPGSSVSSLYSECIKGRMCAQNRSM